MTTTVNVWAGINAEDEFILVSSIVLESKLITHNGVSIMLVPVRVPHAVAFEPIDTYVGNLIRIFPFGLNASLIVIVKVNDVILLTTSLALPLKDPLNVVALATNDWKPTWNGNPFLIMLNLKFPVG